MGQYLGIVKELISRPGGERMVWIGCPPSAIPAPGQYMMAWAPEDNCAPLAAPLYQAMAGRDGFLAAPPAPAAWEPGMQLELRGPNGRGFQLSAATRRLAVAALGNSAARLLPMVGLAIQMDISIALFSSVPPDNLPAAVEIYPAADVHEALAWADLLLLDLAVDELGRLRKLLRLDMGDNLPCPAQALVYTNLPCGGLAECGACFVPGRRKWKQACQDGPVFDLAELDW